MKEKTMQKAEQQLAIMQNIGSEINGKNRKTEYSSLIVCVDII